MTIQQATNRAAKLLLLAFAALLTCLSLGGAPAGAATGPCTSGCIKTFDLERYLNFATFKVKATTAVKPTLTVWESGQAVSFKQTYAYKYAHTMTVPNLKANTLYGYSLTLKDLNGGVQVKQGGFKTLQRTVKVTVHDMWIENDGDSSGAGEIRAGIRMSGDPLHHESIFGYKSLNNGDYLYLNKTYTRTTMPAQSNIRITLYEDDADPLDFCTAGSLYFPIDTGSDSCADWATAVIPVTLPTANGTHLWTTNVTKLGPVGFTVQVKVVTTIA